MKTHRRKNVKKKASRSEPLHTIQEETGAAASGAVNCDEIDKNGVTSDENFDDEEKLNDDDDDDSDVNAVVASVVSSLLDKLELECDALALGIDNISVGEPFVSVDYQKHTGKVNVEAIKHENTELGTGKTQNIIDSSEPQGTLPNMPDHPDPTHSKPLSPLPDNQQNSSKTCCLL